MSENLANQLQQLDSSNADYATTFVEKLLSAALVRETSDVHIQPTREGLSLSWRIDGVLQRLGVFPPGNPTDVVTRLKVMSGLLTYRTDIPQEGRLPQSIRHESDMRVSTFPTLYGERAVIRVFAVDQKLLYLDQLGLTENTRDRLRDSTAETSGAILITGPAGSGKTTTAYACLRQIVKHSPGRSIVSLEDPIEVPVDGVAQSQTNDAAGFDLQSGLKSLLRQDPEVMFVGEMRDDKTASLALQASLTGQLVVTTFHAGSCAEAISRLLNMKIEPYVITSGILHVVCQRLVRKLCDCANLTEGGQVLLGLPAKQARVANGCDRCRGTGYRGRIVLTEMTSLESTLLSDAILTHADSVTISSNAKQAGMETLWENAIKSVEAGFTSPQEIRRVLGFRMTNEMK